MATKSRDQTALDSSIALLQERFRQLQKIREMREERQLLHVLSESGRHTNTNPTMQYLQPSALFFNSEFIIQQKPSNSQLGLSLWPDSQIKHPNFEGVIETNTHRTRNKSWLIGTTLGHNSPSHKFEDSGSDVDTSLHL